MSYVGTQKHFMDLSLLLLIRCKNPLYLATAPSRKRPSFIWGLDTCQKYVKGNKLKFENPEDIHQAICLSCCMNLWFFEAIITIYKILIIILEQPR